jgi:hypothetical protein
LGEEEGWRIRYQMIKKESNDLYRAKNCNIGHEFSECRHNASLTAIQLPFLVRKTQETPAYHPWRPISIPLYAFWAGRLLPDSTGWRFSEGSRDKPESYLASTDDSRWNVIAKKCENGRTDSILLMRCTLFIWSPLEENISTIYGQRNVCDCPVTSVTDTSSFLVGQRFQFDSHLLFLIG